METHDYPKHYIGPKPIKDQIDLVAELFNLNPIKTLEYLKNLPPLPEGAEGWFAIPRWKIMPCNYGDSVNKTLNLINETRSTGLYNFCKNRLSSGHLRQTERSVRAWKKIISTQRKCEILIISAQFGRKHRGRSVVETRKALVDNEFGLGAFAVGVMTLINPERFIHGNDLCIDCAGDEYNPNQSDNFYHHALESPCFTPDVCVNFGTRPINETSNRFGSATGFLY